MAEALTLTDDELAFFRLTCDLFPVPESPLRFLEEGDFEPEDSESIFQRLEQRGLLNEEGSGAAGIVFGRIEPVSECSARIVVREGELSGELGSYYLAGGFGVSYRNEQGLHSFGEPRSESELVSNLAEQFPTRDKASIPALRLNAGDYLVFALFVRDARELNPLPASDGEDAPMSVDEVLAFFDDEPEAEGSGGAPDDGWSRSVEALCEIGVLERKKENLQLSSDYYPLAREIAADRQRTIARFDFLDDQWLVRELSLYPTEGSVYRLGTERDGSVLIEELSTRDLNQAINRVVSTLPDILTGKVEEVPVPT